MYYNVVEAKYIGEYKLEVLFEDGKKGNVNFQNFIKRGKVFSHLSNIKYLKKFYINKELGTICWPDGLDIAPEVLYSEATGEPLPSWIEKSEETKERVEV